MLVWMTWEWAKRLRDFQRVEQWGWGGGNGSIGGLGPGFPSESLTLFS